MGHLSRKLQAFTRHRLVAVGMVIAIVAGTGGIAAAVSVPSGTLGAFENDGNFLVDTSGNNDWTSVSATVVTDDTADSGFTEGSKELKPTTWECNNGGANPNKGNILRALVNTRVTGTSAYVDLGFVAQNIQGTGDVHLNFEFNQQSTAVTGPFAPGACPITRVKDDLLVTYDFPGGTALPKILLFKWVPHAVPNTSEDGTWVDLNLQASAARAAVNQIAVADPHGGTIDPQRFGEATIDLLAALPAGAVSGCQTFGQVNVRSRSSGESVTSAIQDKLPPTAIDLSTCGKIIVHKVDDRVPSALPVAGATFGLFANSGATGTPIKTAVSAADGKAVFEDVEPGDYWVKEISPPPGNYTLDPDVIGPITVSFRETEDVSAPFVNPIVRRARIRIDPAQDTNQVGNDHALTVTVTKQGTADASFVPAPGTLVTLSKVSGPGSFKNGANTCTTNAGGVCTVTIVSDDVGLTTVSASADVLVDTKTVSTTTNAQEGSSGPAVKHWVDARLTLTPPQDANRVDDSHTFTAHLEFDTGSGFADAPAGKTITFAIGSGPGSLSAASCTTAANGTCTVNLLSGVTGLTEVTAAFAGTITTAHGTADATAGPDDAVKRWVDVKLDLTPSSAVNRVGDPHTFTAHLMFDKGDGNGFVDASGETIAFTTSGVGSLETSSCTTNGDGVCTVVLNSSVTGSTSVEASWDGDVVTSNGTVNTSISDTATKDWVDALIVINPPLDTNEVGDDHVYTIGVQKSVNGVISPASGVDVDASILSGPGSFDGADGCTTNADGECTVTITSNTSGLTVVQAQATIVVNGKSILLVTDGAGTNAEPAKKRWVNARLSLTPPEDANQVGDAHTFKAHLEFDLGDGNGFADAPAGEAISFSESGPGTLAAAGCTTNGAGECTVNLSSAQTGLSTVTATWDGTITTAEGTAALSAKTDQALKRWVDVRLSLTPPEAANQVGDAHTFKAHLEFDTGSGFSDAPAGKTIALSKVSGPGTLSADSCTTTADGECTVTLSSGTTGLTTVGASFDGTVATAEGVAAATAGPDEALKRWVDVRLSLTPPEAANQVGDDHTFTAHLEFDTGAGFSDAPAGKTIALTKVSGPETLSASSCTTNADGECSVTLSSATTGLTTVGASFDGTVATAEGVAAATAGPDEALKRWVDARLSLTPPQAANRVGDTHTFTAHLELDTGSGFVDAPAGEQIDFTENGPGTLAASSCTTAAGGTCTVDLDSPTLTGLSTVEASWSGGIATAQGSADADAAPARALKRWVDVRLAIDPPAAVNRIGDTHTFTAHLEFDTGDGNGFADAPAGEVIDFTKTGVGTLAAASCTTDAAGTCTVDLESDVTGSTTVDASWDGHVVTANGTVDTPTSDAATKDWVDAFILINPPQATNEVSDDHVFTISLKQQINNVTSPAAGVDVTAEIVSGPGTFVGDDSCVTDASGDCTVTVSSADPGLTTVEAQATVTVNTKSIVVRTDGQGANAEPAVKRWVDARLSVTPPEATNVVGDTHTFSAHLEIDSGSGFGDGPAGETVSFAKTSGPGAFVDDTCVTDATGRCDVQLNSTQSGTTEVEAIWSGDVTTAEGSAALTRASTATKLWIDPSIQLVKTADPILGPPRDVTYTYVVTNTGDSTLTDVLVTDDILGDIGTIDVLEPGETQTLERTVAVDENSPTTNIGEACGTHELGGEVCDTDDADIVVVLAEVAERPTLPRTGFALRLWLLVAGLVLGIGAAALNLEIAVLQRRRARDA